MNCETLVREVGIERVGFLTLTVGDNTRRGRRFVQVWDAAEASRRVNNLARRLLPDVFGKCIIVTERHASGAIHFHLLGQLLPQFGDIRSGFDFEAVKRRDYSSASPALRGLWKLLRDRLPALGFGRAELWPVRTIGKQIASYIAKYIEKNVCARRADDHRKKLVRYHGFGGSQLRPNDFSWATEASVRWRTSARFLARLVTVTEREHMALHWGPRWAFKVTRIMPILESHGLPFGEAVELAKKWMLESADSDAERYLEGVISRAQHQRPQCKTVCEQSSLGLKLEETPDGKTVG